MINPQRHKYHRLYWDMAIAAAHQSTAERCKVGAVIVTATGMISVGWNGMPAGMSNECESWSEELGRLKTKPEVMHAERNALDKMARQGVPAEGAILFVTRAPCIQCAKSLLGIGLKSVYYLEPHDDMTGVELLEEVGIYSKCEADIIETSL